MIISSWSARPDAGDGRVNDLTSLAVRAGNLRAGVSTIDRGPAVVVDPRVTELARTVAASGASAPANGADAVEPIRDVFSKEQLEELAQATAQADRADAERVERWRRNALDTADYAERLQASVYSTKETIRLFDETGRVHLPDQHGRLVPAPERLDFAAHGGPAGYIEALKKRLPANERGVANWREAAAQWMSQAQASKSSLA